MLCLAHAGTGHRQRGRRQSCTPPRKDEEEEEGGEGALVETTATSTLPGRILLSRMGGAQVWGVAASLWFPLRYPSRTEHRPLARGKQSSVRGVILHPKSLLSHPAGPLPMDGLPSWWFKLLVSALGSSPASPGLVTPGILGR